MFASAKHVINKPGRNLFFLNQRFLSTFPSLHARTYYQKLYKNRIGIKQTSLNSSLTSFYLGRGTGRGDVNGGGVYDELEVWYADRDFLLAGGHILRGQTSMYFMLGIVCPSVLWWICVYFFSIVVLFANN